jgi:hypothetical protein
VTKILVLTHEQRGHFSLEPGYFEVILPLAVIEGVDVIPYPYQRWTRSKDGNGNFLEHAIYSLFEDITAICNAFRPDIILNLLSWHHECIPGSLLNRIREECCEQLVTIYFDHDETNQLMLEAEKTFFEASKINIFADSPLRVKRIRKREGCYRHWNNTNSALFCPCPVDHNVYRQHLNPSMRIGLMGSLEGRRMEVMDFLVANVDQLFVGASLLDKKSFLPLARYADEIGHSLVNVVSATQTYRSQIKGRSFQVIATGTCLLEEENKDNRSFFDDDFVWFWSHGGDLLDAIEGILSAPASSLERARAYTEKMRALTDPENWIRNLLERLNGAD